MKKTFPFVLCLVVLGCASCTEATRFLEDKSNAKAPPTSRSNDAGLTLKASPSASSSPKVTIAKTAAFAGDIAGKAGKEKLYAFLEKNDQKIVALDLLLSDEQLEELNDVDKGKRWYFDLAYPDKEGFNTGGELLIDISKGKSGLRLDGNHLLGQIKVTGWAGPHQGLMSINARPVTETAEAKPITEGKVAPSPSTKPPMATRPRSAM